MVLQTIDGAGGLIYTDGIAVIDGFVSVIGYSIPGDGGGGEFYWDNTSTDNDNGGTIFQVVGISVGRWKRLFSGSVNVKWFGAKGDDYSDDSDAFIRAINFLKQYRVLLYSSPTSAIGISHLFLELYVPNGIYILSQKIEIPCALSITGESMNGTYLQTFDRTITLLEVSDVDSIAGTNHLYFTTIKNLSIYGFHANRNIYEYKQKPNVTNIGMNILRPKTKIQNCTISGFEGSAIGCISVYYTYLTNSYILHSTIGINMSNTSTSLFAINSEIRENSIGIKIANSWSCYFTNCMFETNRAQFLPPSDMGNMIPVGSSRGIAVVIESSRNIIFSNCYFENHAITYVIDSSVNNIVDNCLVVPDDSYNGTTNPNARIAFFLATMSTSIGNKFLNNTYLTPGSANPFLISNSMDYSNTVECNTAQDFNGFVSSPTGHIYTIVHLASNSIYTQGAVRRMNQAPTFAQGNEPISPLVYDFIFDTTVRRFKYWDGIRWIYLGKEISSSGTTANRPTLAQFIDIGQPYYDTTIQKFVFWNGVLWTEAEPPATITVPGTVKKSAALISAIPTNAAGATPTKSEFDAVVTYLNDLVTKLKEAGIQS
ncbi:MAG: glycosyl hydrolase family 28-related protein [Niabella sp.]